MTVAGWAKRFGVAPGFAKTIASLPAAQASAPEAGLAATCSIHLPPVRKISSVAPSAPIRTSRPSSPPETKPSSQAARHSAAPSWAAIAVSSASSRTRRTVPSPSVKAATPGA